MTQMDISYWTRLNPKIRVRNVTRLFFGEYSHKLEISVVGASMLRTPEIPLADQVEHRRLTAKNINWGGSWVSNRMRDPSVADLLMLETFNAHRSSIGDTVKIRIEEPVVHLYANNESTLYDFAKLVCAGTNKQFLSKIHRPKSKEILDLINSGYVVKQRSSRYPYKALIREGRYPTVIKTQLLNYLRILETAGEVQIPGHLIDALERSFESIWGGYFYFKDPSIPTMIGMMSAGFIRSIEETKQIGSDK